MCLKITAKINPRTGDIESVEVEGASEAEYETIRAAVAVAGGEPETVAEEVEYHYNDIVTKVAEG